MSKDKTTGEAAVTVATKKGISNAVLIKEHGIIGNVLVVVKKAFDLAGRNEMKGTVREGKKFSPLYSRTKDGGSFWAQEVTSDEFIALKDVCRKALPDLKKSEYSKNVVAVVDAFIALPTFSGGPREFNAADLDGVDFDQFEDAKPATAKKEKAKA